jgi:hypothetical protein
MTTDLRDELARLADGTPTTAPPGDLWSRGVRRQRRSRALTTLAAAAAVLVAVGVSTVGWDAVRTTEPEPVPTAADARAIPNRLETPSRFTASTEDGPIGPLAVIAGAERASGWSGNANGLVAVAAETGEYRFLDLPGLVSESDDPFAAEVESALSPDGRSVAYWLGQADRSERIGGFAVYDAVSGEVTRHEVDSDLGLSADGLQWIDADTVLVTYGQVTAIRDDGGAARAIRSRLWSPATDRLTDLKGDPVLWQASPVESGFADLGSKALRFWDGDSGQRVARVPITGRPELQESSVDPSGGTVAALEQTNTGFTTRLLVGSVAETVTFGRVRAEVELWQLLGWQDDQHVVARGLVPNTKRTVAAVFSVDVRTGEAIELVREARENWSGPPQYASDLWTRPTVDRPGPDRVIDPRLRAAGAAALVVVVGGLVLVVRRRRARA